MILAAGASQHQSDSELSEPAKVALGQALFPVPTSC